MKNRILYLIGKFFGRISFFYFGVILQHIAHRMMGIGNYENDLVSGEEFVVKTIKKKTNKKSLITFDVGAGEKGENAILVHKYFPRSKVYLFEPMPISFSKLEENLGGIRSEERR